MIVDAFKAANKKLVPVVGADNNGFMGQMIDNKDAGLIAVTNPPAVGGAGLGLALSILDGKKTERVVHLTPKVYDSSTDAGQQWAKSGYDAKVDPTYPLYSGIAPYTHYTPEQEKGLQGPRRILI